MTSPFVPVRRRRPPKQTDDHAHDSCPPDNTPCIIESGQRPNYVEVAPHSRATGTARSTRRTTSATTTRTCMTRKGSEVRVLYGPPKIHHFRGLFAEPSCWLTHPLRRFVSKSVSNWKRGPDGRPSRQQRRLHLPTIFGWTLARRRGRRIQRSGTIYPQDRQR